MDGNIDTEDDMSPGSHKTGMIDSLCHGVVTHGPEMTQGIAASLAGELPAECVLCLTGPPGAGKTTFVKGLASGWQIENEVCSPTFNLYFQYRGLRTLLHLDAYRLSGAEEAEDLLLEEFLNPPYCLAIEWPERVPSAWLEKAWWLEFRTLPEQQERLLRLRRGSV